ncbi:Cell division cycle and apoptosis regulator protein [Trichinella pseudospiralis]
MVNRYPSQFWRFHQKENKMLFIQSLSRQIVHIYRAVVKHYSRTVVQHPAIVSQLALLFWTEFQKIIRILPDCKLKELRRLWQNQFVPASLSGSFLKQQFRWFPSV